VPILYRAALLPLSDDGVAIDHVLGAANHRTLLADEPTMTRVVRKRWIYTADSPANPSSDWRSLAALPSVIGGPGSVFIGARTEGVGLPGND
jgi:hypothetical protein